MIDWPVRWYLVSHARRIDAVVQSVASYRDWRADWEVLRQRDWTLTKLGFCLLAVPWATGAAAFHWLAAVPESPNCQTSHWAKADLARLQCLQQKMRTGESRQVLAGIRQLKDWPQDSPVYLVSQQLLEDWSVVAWSQAQVEFDAGEWETSARLVAEIPRQFELWNHAQARSTLWKNVQSQGEQLYGLAQAAIQAQNWAEALKHAQALTHLENDYWRRQGIRELPSLIQARQASAQDAASPGPLASSPLAPRAANPASQRTPLRLSPPLVVSLNRPSSVEPAQVRPEFSVA